MAKMLSKRRLKGREQRPKKMKRKSKSSGKLRRMVQKSHRRLTLPKRRKKRRKRRPKKRQTRRRPRKPQKIKLQKKNN